MISDLELISPFQECVELEAAGTPIKENPERKEEIELSLGRCKRAKTRPNHLEGYDPSTKNSSQTQHCRSNTRRKEEQKNATKFRTAKISHAEGVCGICLFHYVISSFNIPGIGEWLLELAIYLVFCCNRFRYLVYSHSSKENSRIP